MNIFFKRVRINSLCVLSAFVFSLNNKQPGRISETEQFPLNLERTYTGVEVGGGGDGFD